MNTESAYLSLLCRKRRINLTLCRRVKGFASVDNDKLYPRIVRLCQDDYIPLDSWRIGVVHYVHNGFLNGQINAHRSGHIKADSFTHLIDKICQLGHFLNIV